jgi:hypothetical protein
MNHKTPEEALQDLEHAVSVLTVENIRLKDENEKLSRHNNVTRDLSQSSARQEAWESRHHNSSGSVSP